MMCAENHGGRDYDIENFVKPVIDGVAMGLWGNLDAVLNDPSPRFDADDSVFGSVYLENCPVEASDVEGVYIVVAPLNRGKHAHTHGAVKALVELYEVWDKPNQARAWQAKQSQDTEVASEE